MDCNCQVMKVSQPISRVLSRAIIHLWPTSPQTFSSLPESNASNIIRFLFGLTPSGVYLATSCYQLRGALLPHHFTLTHRRLKSDQGGIFSVALAVSSHPQALPGTLLFGARTFLPSSSLCAKRVLSNKRQLPS